MKTRESEFHALLPRPERSTVVVGPPGDGEGYWAGAPSAVESDGRIYLAYRLRRPIGEGRGYAIVVACSDDGRRFETLVTIGKDEMDAESLERPALVRTREGRWRLYLSCATAGTKHWRVEVLEAGDPAGFSARDRRVVLPGDARTGVKDPVIVERDGLWHLWASCHPLDEPDQADQMVTEYATSADGLEWTWRGPALGRRAGAWDSRGVRVSAVRFTSGTVVAAYDGRASALENCEERTGIATGGDPGALAAVGSAPWAESPHRGGGLRYLDILRTSDGRHRLFYELTRPDGAHELRAELR
ncbi:hypothetical protein [Actinomadura rubrisoli]|uniref:Exo-alpha-sialidase n=1 Tax=Actinomadura rubrisoli TaxID=2530368 RepID=A0A4R5AT43_9ACTN|nr:hypothetical protein [Actinomadura rubrisoli]TDD74274.1 hypothetical protein E1298_32775 [Actinomadura rubrisoli]